MAGRGTAEVHVKVVGLDEALEKVRAACADLDTRMAELAAAFRLWQERYVADPAAFADDWAADAEYGEAAATYLLRLLAEIRETTDEVPA